MKKSELPDTAEFLKDIGTLIVEVRTPESTLRGRVEGVHCTVILNKDLSHECSEGNIECTRISELQEALTPLPANEHVTIRVDVVGLHLDYDPELDQMVQSNTEILIERWSITLKQDLQGEQGCTPLMLLQAIHSHLHFSQLSAWLSKSHGQAPADIEYRVQPEQELKFRAVPDLHMFPIARVGESFCTVAVHSTPRCSLQTPVTTGIPKSESKPVKLTLPLQLMLATPSTRAFSSGVPSVMSPSNNQHIKKKLCCEVSPRHSPRHVQHSTSPPSDGGLCVLAQTTDPFLYASTECLEDSQNDSGIHSPSRKVLNGKKFPFPSLALSPSRYICEDSELYLPTSPILSGSPPLAHSSPVHMLTSSPLATGPPISLINSIFGSPSSSSSFNEEEDETDEVCDELSTMYSGASPPNIRASWHGNPFLEKPNFKRSTSLPLLSSPVLCRKDQQCWKEKKGHTLLANSQKCLLGTFEECILKGRLIPSGSVAGFKFKMSANGKFNSPPITLPFASNFYHLSEDCCPSPYTGRVSLAQCGTHGYQVSRCGRLQATILDPNNSVVKLFLLPYDVSDMPPRSQTFVRQRIYALQSEKPKVLQYLINIRLSSGRSSKIYLHTDIHLIFMRGSLLSDSSDEEMKLETDICLPSSPKYSPLTRTSHKRKPSL